MNKLIEHIYYLINYLIQILVTLKSFINQSYKLYFGTQIKLIKKKSK